jgi:superfamily I DNA and RNA helicase
LNHQSIFITTEPLGSKGEKGEQLVWETIQTAFAQRECLGYWRYPIFSPTGKFRQEPDILIADRQLGLIVIEVKAIASEQIITIQGHRWQYQNFYTAYGNPYQQAENQLFALLEHTNQEPTLQGNISSRVLIALPYINQQQWCDRGFDRLPSNPPILFQEYLEKPTAIYQLIEQIPPVIAGSELTPTQWQLLLSVLGGTPVLMPPSRRILAPQQSRGKILKQARSRFTQLDIQQEKVAKQIPEGFQRIRGIAGSGKTVLLCQKAAHMHLKHPDWQIAIVFFSRSLYQVIKRQIDLWLRYFTNNQLGYNRNNSYLQILHAWGGKQQPGFYSNLCQLTKINPLTVNETQSQKPNEALAEVCLQLLESTTIPQVFDAILIDEGQDLVVNNWQYQNKQPFYWLAYQSLRPVNPIHPQQRRLIWAYDEAQSLDNLKVPTASELFGEELAHLATGKYANGSNKTEIMYRCYRTPHEILTLAHGISMGLLRPQGMLTGITCREDWEAIGYQLKGKLQIGEKITLKRPRENSPNPISQLWQGKIIDYQIYSSRQQELTALANKIKHNLRYDGLRPSKEILVIILGTFWESSQLINHAAKFLIKQGIEIYLPGNSQSNLLHTETNKCKPNQFWSEGAITLTPIHRAKGQEADMVYLIGLDRVAETESNIYLRNQLLVALTRSRGWVNISGIGSYPFYQEMQKVIDSGDTFVFTYQHPPQRIINVTEPGELLYRYALGGRNFRNAHLEKANLSGICLNCANLIGANLGKANLEKTQLVAVKLIVANLSRANLSFADLRQAKLMGANLQKANLSYANLTGADLSNADLKGAKLIGTNLINANLTGVNWQETDLSKTKLG